MVRQEGSHIDSGAPRCARVVAVVLAAAACAACGDGSNAAARVVGDGGLTGTLDAAASGDGAAGVDAASEASVRSEAAVPEGGSPQPVEGGGGDGGACELGAAGSFATDQSLDLFGDTIYFADGQDLPAGRYRVRYVDGCMKFNALFGWTATKNDGWWLVGASTDDRVQALPGVSGNGIFDGFSAFDDCVAANQAVDPVEFDFDGGPLGIWLNDAPYQDNVAGQDGRNPTWELTLLVEECPPELMLF